MTELPEDARLPAVVRDMPWAAPDTRPADAGTQFQGWPDARTSAAAGHLSRGGPTRTARTGAFGSGSVPLRPLDLGDVLDGTFAAIRRNPRTVLGLAALLVTLQELLTLIVQAMTGDLPDAMFNGDGDGIAFFGGTGLAVGLVIRAVIGAVLTGMIVVVVSEDVLGRRPTVGAVWHRVRKRLGGLIVAALLVGVLPYAALLLLVAPGVLLWGGWALTMPALVLEGQGPLRAIRRSWRLAWPAFWRVWSVRLLSVVLGRVMEYLVAIPFALVAAVTTVLTGADTDGQLPAYALAVVALGAVVAGTLVEPFYAGVLALLYIDRRMRAEGLDITLQIGDRPPGIRGQANPGVSGIETATARLAGGSR